MDWVETGPETHRGGHLTPMILIFWSLFLSSGLITMVASKTFSKCSQELWKRTLLRNPETNQDCWPGLGVGGASGRVCCCFVGDSSCSRILCLAQRSEALLSVL